MEIQKESYEGTEQKARDLYKAINATWCPILNDNISFNRRGFQHLIGKGGFLRPKSERRRRFALLPYVQTIQNPDATVSHDIKMIRNSKADFWTFEAIVEDMDVTVVIRQVGRGKKHFFSIYGKIRKSAP